ncbi:deoxynucleoside triphosphate triphosphohydrolase SAMHD1-like [Embiotoca jacksoni]|uniref:deoxynucleoside triphosphate triphosphohydrolase SAMHD1-like n=1 Tax=Embiotoca jacksoni TaxID=100190 RepID=UPI003703B31B
MASTSGQMSEENLTTEGWGKQVANFIKEKRICKAKLKTSSYHYHLNKFKKRPDRLWLNNSIRAHFKIKNGPKVFNDPIHGTMEIHPLLVTIIDTPQFQRLRHIKQLGGTYYVFPGASHNRFEHSIGVSHLAGEFLKTLKSNQPELNITERDILCVQIAGLCHDLGHGPFSHLFDDMFTPKLKQHNPAAAQIIGDWTHEKASLLMFDHMVDVNGLEPVMEQYGLELPDDCEFIKEMIGGPPDDGQYVCRPNDKAFLYEIVANKTNGIDVDKFDYFARDCYHLGIKANFDHRRLFMFSRVMKVDGKMHICFRDKEVNNLYDMFHTRICIHRACKHKVTMSIQMMITDALLKADVQLHLSTAFHNPEAYTKLTDQVFEEILRSTSYRLKEAREILERLVCRDLYKLVGEAKLKHQPGREISQGMIGSLEEELEGLGGDTEVIVVPFDYGMNDDDPIANSYFYRKNNGDQAFKMSPDQMSGLPPQRFSEKILRVYWKSPDVDRLEDVKRQFQTWCPRNGFQLLFGDRVQPEA